MSAVILPFRAMHEKPAGPNRIREMRRRKTHSSGKEWTQGDLAEAVGLSVTQISDLERGTKPLTLGWMEAIAGALDCAVSDLLIDRHNPDRLRGPGEEKLVRMYRDGSDPERAQLLRVSEAVTGYRAPPPPGNDAGT